MVVNAHSIYHVLYLFGYQMMHILSELGELLP